jgi:hypothetical protein
MRRDWLELQHYHLPGTLSQEKNDQIDRVVIITLGQALARLPFWACSYKIWSVEGKWEAEGNLLNGIYLFHPWISQ